MAMATIHEEVLIDVEPATAWDALADWGGLHERLARGFVTDTRLDGADRIVTFASGAELREVLITSDAEARRLVWSVVGGPYTHHNGSAQILGGARRSDAVRLDRRPPPRRGGGADGPGDAPRPRGDEGDAGARQRVVRGAVVHPARVEARSTSCGATVKRSICRDRRPSPMPDASDHLARTVLPIPDIPPVGLTTYDAKDPDTTYPPIVPLRPPAGAPNVLIVLIDDVGFGASSAFGGPCQTPNFERLAADGLKYTPLPHDGAVLADPLGAAHRPQPPLGRDGRHRRARDLGARATTRSGPTPPRRWPKILQAQRLQHGAVRQVPRGAGVGDQPDGAVPAVADRAWASSTSTASSAARRTSTTRRSTRARRRSSRTRRPRRATTSTTT